MQFRICKTLLKLDNKKLETTALEVSSWALPLVLAPELAHLNTVLP